MKADVLDQAALRELLDYNAETGVFRWRFKRGNLRAGTVAGGRPNHSGHRIIGIGRKGYRAGRLAWLHVTGEWPPAEIDHINNDAADDRFVNLRPATSAENKWNTRKSKNHTGKFKGAYYHKQCGRWRSQIMKHGKLYNLGMFDTPEEAHLAYRAKAADSLDNLRGRADVERRFRWTMLLTGRVCGLCRRSEMGHLASRFSDPAQHVGANP